MSLVCLIVCSDCDEKINTRQQLPHGCSFLVFLSLWDLLALLIVPKY